MGLVLAAAAEPDGFFGRFVAWAVDLMERLGGPGAGIAIALENVFPPLPSELILPLAGFTASQGRLSLASAIVWTTIGSVVGAAVLYEVGRILGADRIRVVAAWLPLVNVADVDRTVAWFARHGRKAVFFGRMIPIFRSLVSIPAGVERMPWPVFLLFTTLGSLLWNTIFIVAGYVLGENYTRVLPYGDVLSNVVLVAAAAFLVWFVVSRVLERRRTPDRDQLRRPTEERPDDAS